MSTLTAWACSRGKLRSRLLASPRQSAEHPELLMGEELKELLKHADKVSDAEFRKRLAEGLKGPKSVVQRLAEEKDWFT